MVKLSDDDRILKEFLDENFDFYTLRKVGRLADEWSRYNSKTR